MTKNFPTHGSVEELYFGSYDMYKKFRHIGRMEKDVMHRML